MKKGHGKHRITSPHQKRDSGTPKRVNYHNEFDGLQGINALSQLHPNVKATCKIYRR